MKNTDISTLLKPVARIIERFHTTIFIVILVVGLACAVLLLSSVISDASTGTGGTAAATTNTFDASTIQRLSAFHTSDQATPPAPLPTTRTNPFTE